MSQNNKVALITGAGVGIGRAAAKALLQGGYQVVLTGRNLDKLQKAMNDIGGTADNCLAVACDVGKPDQVKTLFAAIKEKFGRIEVINDFHIEVLSERGSRYILPIDKFLGYGFKIKPHEEQVNQSVINELDPYGEEDWNDTNRMEELYNRKI